MLRRLLQTQPVGAGNLFGAFAPLLLLSERYDRNRASIWHRTRNNSSWRFPSHHTGLDTWILNFWDCQKFCVLSPVDLTIDLEPIAEHHGKLRLCRTPFASRHLPLLGDLAQL
jgi:hypothetical protein